MPMTEQWVFRAGEASRDGWNVVIDDSIAGWSHTGLRVGALTAGRSFRLPADNRERIVVPLAGSFTVEHGDARAVVELRGRESVFDGPTDVLFVGAGTHLAITGRGTVAVAEAVTTVARDSVHILRDGVPVEVRGAGQSSRQVHNFGIPGVLDADRIIACEVITPAGNWSSYPPHKHDQSIEGVESELEEIYYFESAVERGAPAHPAAMPFGLFATSSSVAGVIEINERVESGDVALVPYGYHGPAVAAPGYDLYYLNVMAGPGPVRAWEISDHPAHTWVRDTWPSHAVDSRLPFERHARGASQ